MFHSTYILRSHIKLISKIPKNLRNINLPTQTFFLQLLLPLSFIAYFTRRTMRKSKINFLLPNRNVNKASKNIRNCSILLIYDEKRWITYPNLFTLNCSTFKIKLSSEYYQLCSKLLKATLLGLSYSFFACFIHPLTLYHLFFQLTSLIFTSDPAFTSKSTQSTCPYSDA